MGRLAARIWFIFRVVRSSFSAISSSLAGLDLLGLLAAVDGQAHGVGLLGDGLLDGLPDPPHGVADEPEVAPLVETLGGGDQADVALGDQVHVAEALVQELLGHRHHEPQVRVDQAVEGILVALADAARQFELLLLGQEAVLADHLQVVLKTRVLAAVTGKFDFVHGAPPSSHREPLRGLVVGAVRGDSL